MRHKYAGYKLKRTTSGRNALLRNLVTSIIEAERVVTTVPKAKAVRPLVEQMISTGQLLFGSKPAGVAITATAAGGTGFPP